MLFAIQFTENQMIKCFYKNYNKISQLDILLLLKGGLFTFKCFNKWLGIISYSSTMRMYTWS